MEPVFSPFKIAGFVLIISGLVLIYYMPGVLEKQAGKTSGRYEPGMNKTGGKKNVTRTVLYIAGAIDLILGLLFISGIIP